ncbi:MAG: nonstructural protein [Microvirus sp.]|nr:MAG: nonstructural protein [Microvirus sp.]
MTIHKTVAIRDIQLAAFGRPFYTPTLGAAIRSFHDEAKNPESMIHNHPEDFELMELGEYNDETGQHKNLDTPRQLSSGKTAKGAA